jgi:hypothetical protein
MQGKLYLEILYTLTLNTILYEEVSNHTLNDNILGERNKILKRLTLCFLPLLQETYTVGFLDFTMHYFQSSLRASLLLVGSALLTAPIFVCLFIAPSALLQRPFHLAWKTPVPMS